MNSTRMTQVKIHSVEVFKNIGMLLVVSLRHNVSQISIFLLQSLLNSYNRLENLPFTP